MAKLAYLRRSLISQVITDRFKCPNCASQRNQVVDRKLFITQLRRCRDCHLMFRTPTDDPAANEGFYEKEYQQGFTSTVPSDAALAEMLQTNFAGTEKNYSYYLDVLTQLGLKSGSKIFDFGCSWGYGSFQLANAGFSVTSFEVAPGRRRYAKEKVGVAVIDDMAQAVTDLEGQFDCFFSAHVVEHVPSPAAVFDYAMRLLKQGGIFVSFTPNGSASHRASSGTWSKLWGEVHPTFIDDVFLDYSFRGSPRAAGSSPIKNAMVPATIELSRLNQLEGSEIFFAARKIKDGWA